jgi:hypothetical protein
MRNIRTISILLCVVLLLVSVVPPVNALSQTTPPSLYIQTTSVSEDVINYAKANAYRFMCSGVDEGTISEEDVANLQLGTPFALTNTDSRITLYYFPIINGQKIIATLRVYRVDGEFYGIYSSALVDELNFLAHQTSSKKPARFSAESGILAVTFNGKRDVIWKQQVHNSCEPFTDRVFSTKTQHDFSYDGDNHVTTVVNCFSAIDFEKISNSAFYQGTRSFPPYKYLGFANYLIEQQPSNLPWCAAYVAAFIVRFLNSNTTTPTAYSVMATMYPNETYAQLASHELSDANAVAFYTSCGFSSLKVWWQLSDSAVRTAIVNNKPIHLLCSRVSDLVNHSIALVGYNDNTSILRIWNPWYGSAEDMDDATKIYTAMNGDAFEWLLTITIN